MDNQKKYHEDLMFFTEFQLLLGRGNTPTLFPRTIKGSYCLGVFEEHRGGSATITDATLDGHSLDASSKGPQRRGIPTV